MQHVWKVQANDILRRSPYRAPRPQNALLNAQNVLQRQQEALSSTQYRSASPAARLQPQQEAASLSQSGGASLTDSHYAYDRRARAFLSHPPAPGERMESVSRAAETHSRLRRLSQDGRASQSQHSEHSNRLFSGHVSPAVHDRHWRLSDAAAHRHSESCGTMCPGRETDGPVPAVRFCVECDCKWGQHTVFVLLCQHATLHAPATRKCHQRPALPHGMLHRTRWRWYCIVYIHEQACVRACLICA